MGFIFPAFAAMAVSCSDTGQPQRPNILLIVADDLGMGDVKLAGTAALFAGLYRMLWVLLLGTGLAAAVLYLRMIGRKGSRRDTVPLAPFLLGGFLLEFLLRFSLPGLF